MHQNQIECRSAFLVKFTHTPLKTPDWNFVGVGGIVTTMNPDYTSHEVFRQLKMSKSKIILTQPKSLKVVQEAVSMLKGPIDWNEKSRPRFMTPHSR